MKNFSKIACLMLVLLMLCSCMLSACSDDGDEASTPSQAAADDPYKDDSGMYVGQTSGKTYGGTVITILTCGVNPTYNSEIISNVNNELANLNDPLPDVIDSAQGVRISYVEEKLDVVVQEMYLHDPSRYNGLMIDRITQDNLAYMADYQIIVPCLYDGATLAEGGQLINLFDLPGIQMDAPWWDQTFNKIMTINNQLYFTIGDIGTVNKSATAALTFNKDLYNRYNLSDKYGGTPYDLVRAGTWTLDVAIEMTKELGNDINGDGTIDYNDEYGWGGQLDDLWSLFYGSGSKIASTDTADGYPELTMYSERSARVMEKIQTLVQDRQHYISANDYFDVTQWPTELLRKNFIQGKSLFYNGSLSTPIELGDMVDTFGLLPIPKGDKEQDAYYSLVNPWVSNCFAVPMSLQEGDYQMIADFLNVIGAASANLVADAYLEQCIEYMKSRDQDTIEMIEDYILPGRACDIGMIWKWGGLDQLLHDMASNPVGSFVSSYTSKAGMAQAEMDETIEAFKAHS